MPPASRANLLDPAPLDLREHGANDATSDRRLFVQLLAFTGCRERPSLLRSVEQTGVSAVVYEDLHDPTGVAVLTLSEQPATFVETIRPALASLDLQLRPDYSMFGRTYAVGYEPDLEHTLLRRPIETATREGHDWAIWYPLRRGGAFETLDADEQRAILREHGTIGRRFVEAGVAHDIRLASHGLDPNDSDFTIGLIGPELAPLSQLVQAMRKTRQTSQYLDRLGPFFVGRRVWKSPT